MFPKEIKADRELLEGGRIAFNLRHDTLGELGRIILQPAQQGGGQVTFEVIDLPDGRWEHGIGVVVPDKRLVASG